MSPRPSSPVGAASPRGDSPPDLLQPLQGLQLFQRRSSPPSCSRGTDALLLATQHPKAAQNLGMIQEDSGDMDCCTTPSPPRKHSNPLINITDTQGHVTVVPCYQERTQSLGTTNPIQALLTNMQSSETQVAPHENPFSAYHVLNVRPSQQTTSQTWCSNQVKDQSLDDEWSVSLRRTLSEILKGIEQVLEKKCPQLECQPNGNVYRLECRDRDFVMELEVSTAEKEKPAKPPQHDLKFRRLSGDNCLYSRMCNEFIACLEARS